MTHASAPFTPRVDAGSPRSSLTRGGPCAARRSAVLGRQAGNRNNKKKGRGYSYLHHAVDGG
jgi:hypothetical protein